MEAVHILSPHHFELYLSTKQNYPSRLNVHISQNLYDILGVKHDAGQDEIRNAYKVGARKWHPDKNVFATGITATLISNRFLAMSNAAEILLDPETRSNYDAETVQNPDTFTQNPMMTREDAMMIFTRIYFMSLATEYSLNQSKMKFFFSVLAPLVTYRISNEADTTKVVLAIFCFYNGDGFKSVISELSEQQKKDVVTAATILMDQNPFQSN